jgi:chromosome segregation ATPase
MDEREKARLRRELRKLHTQGSTKKSVNFRLFAIIVILLAALGGLAFYASWKHNDLLVENREFAGVREMISNELSTCGSRLAKAEEDVAYFSSQLNISSASQETLNELYAELASLKAQLEGDLTGTQQSLSVCSSDLQSSRAELSSAIGELDVCITDYDKAISDLSIAMHRIDVLRSEVSNLTTDLSKAEDELEELRACVNTNSNCTACR